MTLFSFFVIICYNESMKNKVIKKVLSIVVLFAIFYAITYFINSNITIRGLYKDDLASWAWFPDLSFYEYAIKFYDSVTRYRPVFYALEYIEYMFVGTHVQWFTYINVFLNSIVALFVYIFAKNNSKNKYIAFVISLCYIVSHFSYYQITQVIGILETYSQLFALIILYLLISYLENNNHDAVKLSFIYILYFLVVFTHERYMFLALPILLAIVIKYILNNKDKNDLKTTIINCAILLIELAIIVYIRILSTGKFIPAGTGGTEVKETFNVLEAITFSIHQVLFIFGINIGTEHLVGMPIENTTLFIRLILILSIILLLSIIIIYIITKTKYIKDHKDKNILNYIYKDILYLLFIMLAIGSSSVTIRVEMRFVYVSFTASMLYLAHMIGEIFKLNAELSHTNKETTDNSLIILKELLSNKFIMIIYILFISFFLTRTYVEFRYRETYPKIHCITDLLRVNSMADLTVYKYGIDELKKKKVYILYNIYDWSEFYREYFFKIYDKTNEGLTIGVINGPNDIPKDFDKKNDILLFEDIANYGYQDITEQFIPD